MTAAAVSPGNNNCNLVKGAPFTGMVELVLALLLPSVTSLVVTVRLPVVFKVTLKFRVPEISAALDGKTALVSDDVIATVSVTLVTVFQLESTALTVTLNATAAN